MASIKAESVGFLFNLEVQVNVAEGDPEHPSIAAKGLGQSEDANAQLSYTAPSEDGQVEVRDERGRVEQAETARAQQAADNGRQIVPENNRPTGPTVSTRGAFGQQTAGAPAANRAERRKKKKK
jgi:preprotein translocase subunit SecA